MPVWLNRAVYQLPRNGTTSHTIDPTSSVNLVDGAAFTPTAGRLLVIEIEGAVTSTTPSGWTLPAGGSAINNTGLYVWHRTAASGSNAASTTHNGSNYPVVAAVYEYPDGSAFVKAISGTGVTSAIQPALTGLTGTNLVRAVKAIAVATVYTSAGWTWSGAGLTAKDVDVATPFATTDGYAFTTAYGEAYAGSSWQPTAVWVGSGVELLGAEMVSYAINVPAGGNAGTLSASVPKVTAAIAGTQVNVGTMAATLPKVTASAVGQQQGNAGSFAATLPKVAASVAGLSVNAGALTVATPKVTATIAGSSRSAGTLAATVPRVTTSIADQVRNAGTLAVTLPKVTAALVGTQVNAGVLAATLPRVRTQISDTTSNPGTLAGVVPKVVAALTGVSVNRGTLGAVLPKARSAAVGQQVNPAALAARAPMAVASLTGQLVNPAALELLVPLVRFFATSFVPPTIEHPLALELLVPHRSLELTAPQLALALTIPHRTLELEATMSTVKTGDVYPITLAVNTDLTGSTVRLIARRQYSDTVVILPCTIEDAVAGKIEHQLTGTLQAGEWRLEVEMTRGGQVVTFPTAQDGSAQHVTLRVVADLG